MIEKIYEYLVLRGKRIKWYHYPLEWLVYRYYWNKVILPELIENDDIFGWFEKNDFQLVQRKWSGSHLKTMNICSDFPVINARNKKEQELYVFKDYWASFSNVLDKYATFDLLNHLIMRVEIEDFEVNTVSSGFPGSHRIPTDEKIRHERVFTVFIEFTRRQYIDRIYKQFFTRLFIILPIVAAIIIFIAYYGYNY